MSDINLVKKEFEKPDEKYRSLPFWAWNDKLDPEELKRQIGLMKEQGMGGFFMHSRDGLETPYMGEEWQKYIQTAVAEAKRLNMQAWLYDEDRWPSGTAGGSVPARYGDESRCKGVTMEVCPYDYELPEGDNSVVALYRARINSMDIYESERLSLGENPALQPEENLLVVRLEVSGKSEWFNNEAPPDNLNPVSVKHFIEATHEKYKEIVGDEFGKTVLGIFTDEPSLADRHTAFAPNRGWIPWTYHFDEYFREHRGYDIFDLLPYIYFNGTHSSKIRHDYWWTVSTRYCEAYSKNISEWCEKNNISYTGHFLQEDKLGLSARVNGSIMPHYIYQHVPGIDMLTERTEEYMTVKQCTSVAHQFSKPVVISETYGCTGWEFSFEGQKWVGDWQYVLGVNHRCQHLTLYSIKGCRKRDYPPSFNYNNTWWDCDYMVEDYFARLSAVLSSGRAVRDVLIVHPVSTAWSMLGTNPYGNPVRRNERDVPAIDRYGYEFNDFIKYTLSMHYDLDLGDEVIMSEYAKAEGSRFRIKDAEYKVVILPPMRTILRSTFELLKSFIKNGGCLIAEKPYPVMIEGEASDELVSLFGNERCIITENAAETIESLEKALPRLISITDSNGRENTSMLCSLTEAEDYYSLFVVNNDRNTSQNVTIRLKLTGPVEEWKPLTGEQMVRETITEVGSMSFEESFGPAGSKLYIIRKSGSLNKALESTQSKTESQTESISKVLPRECSIKRNMENVLTLDTCSYSLNGSQWSEVMDIWRMQREVREELSMRQIFHNGIEQRYKWVNKSHENDGQELALKIRFDVEDIPENDVYLVLEEAEHFRIFLNGVEVKESPNGWFLDKAFKKIRLPGLKKGENTLDLTCKYLNSMEIEDCYIIGDFNVTHERSIIKASNTIHVGDWTSMGYFNYPGSITYQYKFEYASGSGRHVECRIDDFSASCIKLMVNKDVYDIPWKADGCVNISSSLVEGTNDIEVTVYGSPRNMLGPFHLAEVKRANTGDMEFRAEGKEYTPDYNVYPYGLFSPPEIIIKKGSK